ncbi:hypothetical protein [Phocaeicola paurosaccharolyticus]|uniref:hypothetical protein n=1 Tax=Phocaeicola paurosaccharolyticus TaxID=732242 RepID=UPI0011DE1ACF|nr:hypothetical protein [Phocaeicola paurosaccharolyticus]MDD4624602.1 hypothetical protein [Bacilli bacterium]
MKNEMYALLEEAYKVYQQEVLQEGKLHRRFANDFANLHSYIEIESEAEAQLHIKKITAIYELLTERMDLVKEYFTKDQFTQEDCELMLHRFNTQEPENSPSTSKPQVLGYFTDQQIELITDFANKQDLFKKKVSQEEFKALFAGTLETPLIANHNGLVACFLNYLRDEQYLVYPWQKVIADKQMICSKSTGKSLTRENLKNALSSFKSSHGVKYLPFEEFIKQLKVKEE